MKKGLLFLVSLIWILPAIAQNRNYFKEQRSAGPQGSFPAFYNKRAQKAVKNINTYLQLATVKTLTDAGTDSAIRSWTFTTPVNNQRALSVSCQPDNGRAKHFLFNAATGSLISLQDIFSVNGLAYIKRQVVRVRQQHAADPRFPVIPEGQEKCMKSDIQEFLLTPDSLIIFPAHCFNTDSAGTVNAAPEKIAFPLASVGQYLSDYGAVIMGITKKPRLKKSASSGVAGLYRGMIDHEEVFLQLDAPFEKSLGGTLYFTRSGQSLSFAGFFKNNRLEIPDKAERLTLNIYPGTVAGQRKAGNKVLSNFTLNRQ